jgi:secreted trypsin-like serine protease
MDNQHMQLLLILFSSLVAHSQVYVQVENGTEVGAGESIGRSVAQMRAPHHLCTASFISEITLLTAGHCIKGDLPSSVRVRIRDARGRVFEEVAKALIRHPGYAIETTPDGGNKVANDFGLIKLKRRLSTPVRPLQIVDPRAQTGTFPVVVLGYGLISKGRSSSVLRRGRMTAQVESVPAFYDGSGLHMVSADSRLNATCPGDSGGPVMVEDRGMRSLIGVHSLSSGCQGEQPTESYSMMPVEVSAWIWANYE